MDVKYTDVEIDTLIQERKPLPEHWRAQLNWQNKAGHKECELDIPGEQGNMFRLILRQNTKKLSNFSAILAVRQPRPSKFFRLLRYNGLHAPHTNRIENNIIDDFHIHRATERYQMRGFAEDAYAEITNRYYDLEGALNCLLEDAGFYPLLESHSRLL